jgi:hypothetical protein
MFNNEDEEWARFRDLTEIMENTGQKQPPDNFTPVVMARFAAEKETSSKFSFRRLFGIPAFATNLTIDFRHPVTKTECAFYFFLTGFFYLVLGFILMLGLPRLAGLPDPGWFAVQPLVGLLLAAELTVLGIAVYKNGDSAVHIARIGTVLYAALIILNCWMGALYIKIPVAIFFAAIFSMTGLGIAFFLRRAIDLYHPETIFSEVSG